MNKSTQDKLEKLAEEFDDNKSQADMPRLYEHIDRVDLWIMAQRKQHQNYQAALAEAVEREKVLVEALDKIDDHIRIMRVEGIIDMKEMSRALKVLSDNLPDLRKPNV